MRPPNTGSRAGCEGAASAVVDKPKPGPFCARPAQVAELVDALVSGTSGQKPWRFEVLSWAPDYSA